jgi:ribosomal protein S12 methylthiotransferase accessory factor
MEVTLDGGAVITAHINGHTIRTDQPLNSGGTNTAPTPFELFLASIGTCAGIFVKTFCDQRKISTEGIKIIQNAEYDQTSGLPTKIKLDIHLPHDFPEKYVTAVKNAAEFCKVKKTIALAPVFEVQTITKVSVR